MKTCINRIFRVLGFVLPLLLAACTGEWAEPEPQLSVSLAVKPLHDGVKSASSVTEATEDAVRNWNLFQFDRGVLQAVYYRDCHYDASDSEAVRRAKSMISGIEIVYDRAYDWFAVANVGDLSETAFFRNGIGSLTVADMQSWCPEIDVAGTAALPMAWKTSGLSVSKQQLLGGYRLPVLFERLVSRYDIVVDQAGLSNWSFTATGLKLLGADSVAPFAERCGFTGAYAEADYATAADLAALNQGGAARYYPLENCFGELLSVSDPMEKNRANVQAADVSARPSYIELDGILTLTDGSGLEKGVTYRFYLGENNTTNFDVVRNVTHVVTLQLTDGLVNGDAAFWKVETGVFSDTRQLAFAEEAVRVAAGSTCNVAVLTDPPALTYHVLMDACLVEAGVTITGVQPNSGTAYSLGSLQINVPDNVAVTGHIRIRTPDGRQHDDLVITSYTVEDLEIPVQLSGFHLESQDDEDLLEFIVDAIDVTLERVLTGETRTLDATGDVQVETMGLVVCDGYESGRGILFHFVSPGSGSITFSYGTTVVVQLTVHVVCDASGHVRCIDP